MPTSPRDVVLLIPGQGAQHSRMAAGLLGADDVFTSTVDTTLAMFGNADELRDAWLAPEPSVPLDHVTRAQPLLFAIGHALGTMLLERGVRPVAMLGHSVGELVAATLAGTFTVAEAVELMRHRVARLADGPAGGMLTVSATEDQLRPFLARHPDVAIGAVNAPRQIVLAGRDAALTAAASDLTGSGFTVRRVPALSPFHSPEIGGLFTDPGPLARFRLAPPRIPVWSAFTGRPLDAAAVADLALWSTQPAAPVLFWPTLARLLDTGRYLLVDVGPGQMLATIARRHPGVRRGDSTVTALLPSRTRSADADVTSVNRCVRDLVPAADTAAATAS